MDNGVDAVADPQLLGGNTESHVFAFLDGANLADCSHEDGAVDTRAHKESLDG